MTIKDEDMSADHNTNYSNLFRQRAFEDNVAKGKIVDKDEYLFVINGEESLVRNIPIQKKARTAPLVDFGQHGQKFQQHGISVPSGNVTITFVEKLNEKVLNIIRESEEKKVFFDASLVIVKNVSTRLKVVDYKVCRIKLNDLKLDSMRVTGTLFFMRAEDSRS